MEPVQKENQKNNRRKGVIIFLISVIIILIGIISYLSWELNNIQSNIKIIVAEKSQTSNEKAQIQKELDSLIIEHNKIKEQYGKYATKLAGKDSIIQQKISKIRELLESKTELKKVKRQLELLREYTQGYVRQVDSLYKINKVLVQENTKIKKDYIDEQEKTKVLTKEKEDLSTKVNTAAILKAFNIIGQGIKSKSGGKKEEIVTKAKRVDLIKVRFALLENFLAVPGNRNLYIRIAGPDKKILYDTEENYFNYKNDNIVYTAMKQVDYQNQNQEVSLYWKKKEKQELLPGTYNIDVFLGSDVIGSGTFTLE